MSHYISNKEFTQAIVEYIQKCESEEAAGREAPQIPDDIARQFIALANKLGSRYNFSGYTFRDEMVSNAIFACCAKIRKFNILVGSNAFAYFTNVCWRAMVDVINDEEEMSYIKAKSFYSVDSDELLQENDMSDFGEHAGSTGEFIPFFDVDEYEQKLKAKKDKAKAKAVERSKCDGPTLEVD